MDRATVTVGRLLFGFTWEEEKLVSAAAIAPRDDHVGPRRFMLPFRVFDDGADSGEPPVDDGTAGTP